MTPDELIEWSVSPTAKMLMEQLHTMANTYPMHGCATFEEYKYREGMVAGIMSVIDYIDSLRTEYMRRQK